MNRFIRQISRHLVVLGSVGVLSMAPVWAHGDHGKPQHGGVVAEAAVAQFEVVNEGDSVVVYAQHHEHTLSTAGASGKVTILAGTQKTELTLQPAGGNKLSAKGNIPSGAKVLLNISLPGQPALQARVVMK